jgi:hypothetical protein
VLVHSFFDFTLHTTANALLFVIICAVATQDTRINTTYELRAHGRPRRRTNPEAQPAAAPAPPAIDTAAAL